MAEIQEQTPANDEERLLRQAFDLFDKDGNGKICEQELITVLQCVGKNPSNKEINDLLKQFDKNGDGVLDYEEFIAMSHFFRGKGGKDKLEQELKQAFKIFDVNDDGFISSDELRHVMMNCGEKLSEEEAELFIATFDQNNDGFLDWKEFVNFYKQSVKQFLETFVG